MADELPATLPIPPHGWTCFYCGETFTTIGSASDHFGAEPFATTACQIKAGDERGLVMALRAAEGELSRYRAEDSDKDREFASLASSIGEKVRLAEEEGYAKALADVEAGKVEPEHRDRILAALRAPRPAEPEAVEAVARAIAQADGFYREAEALWVEHWQWFLEFRGATVAADNSNQARWERMARAALAAIRPADPGPGVRWSLSPEAAQDIENMERANVANAAALGAFCVDAALPQPASDMQVATDAASDRNRPAAGEARARAIAEIAAEVERVERAALAQGQAGGGR